jgi:predicted porin
MTDSKAARPLSFCAVQAQGKQRDNSCTGGLPAGVYKLSRRGGGFEAGCEGGFTSNRRFGRITAYKYDAASGIASTFTERHARVGLSGDFGSVFLGRTSSATDGITQKDLSNSSLMLAADISSMVGGALTPDGNGRTSHTQSFGSVWGDIEGFDVRTDGGDRPNLVRYDSPVFNGLQFSAAVANGGDLDAAVTYNAKYDGLEVLAGLGYINWNNNFIQPLQEAVSGSVAVKFNNGVNFALAGGLTNQNNPALQDGEFYYAKLGYDVGRWGFGADYGFSGQLGNFATALNDAESYGVAAQYDFGKGVVAGLSYRNVDISDGVGAVNQRNDVDLLTAVFAVKF